MLPRPTDPQFNRVMGPAGGMVPRLCSHTGPTALKLPVARVLPAFSCGVARQHQPVPSWVGQPGPVGVQGPRVNPGLRQSTAEAPLQWLNSRDVSMGPTARGTCHCPGLAARGPAETPRPPCGTGPVPSEKAPWRAGPPGTEAVSSHPRTATQTRDSTAQERLDQGGGAARQEVESWAGGRTLRR